MSLSSISSTTSLAPSQFMPLSTKSDADDAPVTNTPATSRFASAIGDAFASIGISLDGTSTSSTIATTDASTPDGGDALGSFLQSLLAALHGQSTGATPPPADASSSEDRSRQAAGTPGAVASPNRGDHVGHAHHGHGGKLEANLRSLITELQSSTATTATADSGTVASTSSTASTDPALATLANKFEALLSASGSSSANSSDSLATFLQTLAAGLHGAPPTGNVVSTQA